MWLLLLSPARSAADVAPCDPDHFAINHRNQTIFSVSREDGTCRCARFVAVEDVVVNGSSLLARVEALEALVAGLVAAQPACTTPPSTGTAPATGTASTATTSTVTASTGSISTGTTGTTSTGITSSGTSTGTTSTGTTSTGTSSRGTSSTGTSSTGTTSTGTTSTGSTSTGTTSTGTTSTASTAAEADDVLYAWGTNAYGQIGDNTIGANRLVPTAVVRPASWNGRNVTAIAAQGDRSMALLSGGVLYAWGRNDYGQIGDNTIGTNRLVPTAVVRPASWNGRNVTAMAAGNLHSMALLSDGVLYAWGRNDNGQIGDNTYGTNRLVPTAVVRPASWTGRNVTAMAAGNLHSMALLSDGLLYAWGYAEIGQIGDNTTETNRPVSTAVVRPASWNGRNVTAIAAGNGHSMALLSGSG